MTPLWTPSEAYISQSNLKKYELFQKKINISIVHSLKIIYLTLKITQDEKPDRKNNYC